MHNYTEPSIVEIGTSSKLIQGSCGFGFENISLDKTGYRKYPVRTDMGNGICYILPLCVHKDRRPSDEC